MWLWWAPLAAAGLHITEEFALPGGFGEWDRAYRPTIRKSITPQLHLAVNLLLIFLCFSVGLAGAGPEGVAVGSVRFRSAIPSRLSAASWVALAGLLGANAVFHALGTIRTRRYSPGLITGVLVYVPLAAFGVWHFIHIGRLSMVAASAWVIVGASYQLWASIAHRLRARGRPTSGCS
jgi:hypothetical protein